MAGTYSNYKFKYNDYNGDQDAYKHIKVRLEDIHLQCIQFLGKYFFECSLVFGTSSSPSIFDRISDIIRALNCIQTFFKWEWTVKQLDDLIPFGYRELVEKFEAAYIELCQVLGVRLAVNDGSAKTFSCSTEGSILGLEYDTIRWEWSFSEKKAAKILAELEEIVSGVNVEIKLLKSLTGRLEFYHQVMGTSARWERGFLLSAANSSDNQYHKVKCSANVVSQAMWWQRAVTAALEYSPIPDPTRWLRQDTLDMYPDAAGGANMNPDRGIGVMMQVAGTCYWSFLAHSDVIKENSKLLDGARIGNKLTFLEGAAALLGVSALAKFLTNKTLVIWSDNSGLCYAHAKGHSTCLYAYTICKAISDMSRRLNCTVVIRKTPRRSGWQEKVADDISKSEFSAAREWMGEYNEFVPPPRTLAKFMKNPKPNRVLGFALAREMEPEAAMLEEEPEIDWEISEYAVKRKLPFF